MRSRTKKARQFEPGGDLRGSAVAALGSHRFDPLSLPVIDQQAVEDKGTSKEATIALHWLDAGYLDESMADIPVVALVKTGFQQWVDQWLGETPCLCPMSLCYSISGDVHSHNEREEPDDWLFSIDLNSPMSRFLEPRFKVIEEKAPVLFQTAMHVYQEVISYLALPGTPESVRQMAEYELWYGTDNHDDFVEEMLSYDYTEDDIAVMLTPNSYRDSVPEWLLHAEINPKKKSKRQPVVRPDLTDKALTALTASNDPELADIAKSVLALKGLKETLQDSVQVIDAAPIYSLAFLRWNEHDEVQRAYDDIIQRANECGDGYTTGITEEWVGSDSESFQKWRERIEPVLTALKHANKLIELLSVPDDRD